MNLERLKVLVTQLQGALGGNQIIAGSVVGTTAPSIAVVSGAGFTVGRTGAGVYQITFDVPFAAAPTVTVGMGKTSAVLWAKLGAAGATTTGAQLLIITTAGAATDGEVHFTAVGPPLR